MQQSGSPVAIGTIGNGYYIIDEIEQAGIKPKESCQSGRRRGPASFGSDLLDIDEKWDLCGTTDKWDREAKKVKLSIIPKLTEHTTNRSYVCTSILSDWLYWYLTGERHIKPMQFFRNYLFACAQTQRTAAAKHLWHASAAAIPLLIINYNPHSL